ncbi:MAG: tripartite tricarboxylate transporter substrate binding protein [Rhodoferax sp.]|jgi:tripartite-type tricarboxylate transporter receptor subunit TctC|nr:tripartite tricarboxylate transporter substrate binding protein [Rhodoferax sp.]
MGNLNRRNVLQLGLGALSLPWAQGALADDAWPSKPIKIIVSVPPGGPADAVCRLVAKQMESRLRQPVIVDNRPGAVGLLALQTAAAAPADGHTLVQIHPGVISGQLLMKRFDMLSGLSPISLAGDFQLAMVVPAGSPYKTFDQFKAAAAKQPYALTYGTLGVGSYEHLLIESLCNTVGIKATHVPYKGGAELVQALLSGQIDFAYLLTQLAYPYINKGQMRSLATLTDARNKVLPDTPTFAELKVPVKVMGYWMGICAVTGTPDAIAENLHKIIVECVKEPVVKAFFDQGGSISRYSDSRASFRKLMEDDQVFLQNIITANNIKIG